MSSIFNKTIVYKECNQKNSMETWQAIERKKQKLLFSFNPVKSEKYIEPTAQIKQKN